MEDLKSPLRISRELCDARAIAMTLIYKHCSEQTLKKIGTLFGGRDHSTIITAIRKTSDLCDSNFDFRRMFNCSESVVKNLLEDVAYINSLKPIIINEKTGLAHGVLIVVLKTLLKIRENGKPGNSHSTVKPIALMQYLLRLVTPPGGKTLDPFAGSGTTGCAAYFENIGEIVLMELDEQGTYIPIIEARTKYWSIPYNRKKFLEDIKDKTVEQPVNQMKMF